MRTILDWIIIHSGGAARNRKQALVVLVTVLASLVFNIGCFLYGKRPRVHGKELRYERLDSARRKLVPPSARRASSPRAPSSDSPGQASPAGGFTLIEFMMVVAIISILASAISLQAGTAIAHSRDSRRKADVNAIAKAVGLYYSETGSTEILGAGREGHGCAFISVEGTVNGVYYPRKITDVLVEMGFLKKGDILDPLMGRDPYSTLGYMLYPCPGGQGFSVYATLEFPKEDEAARRWTSCGCTAYDACLGDWGKNFVYP